MVRQDTGMVSFNQITRMTIYVVISCNHNGRASFYLFIVSCGKSSMLIIIIMIILLLFGTSSFIRFIRAIIVAPASAAHERSHLPSAGKQRISFQLPHPCPTQEPQRRLNCALILPLILLPVRLALEQNKLLHDHSVFLSSIKHNYCCRLLLLHTHTGSDKKMSPSEIGRNVHLSMQNGAEMREI